MILVDTSVWVDHLQRGNEQLEAQLLDAQVVSHPFVIGELACGGITNRKDILTLLGALPIATEATHEEALEFLDSKNLPISGIGWIDVHLLASAVLTPASLWTLDRRLHEVSKTLDLVWVP